jgi:hypothetical protein
MPTATTTACQAPSRRHRPSWLASTRWLSSPAAGGPPSVQDTTSSRCSDRSSPQHIAQPINLLPSNLLAYGAGRRHRQNDQIRLSFLSDRAYGEPHEARLPWRLPGAEMSRTVFVGDQMTHGGQKGFGMTKHGRSGHATRSPRFRFLQKLEAQKSDRKDRSRIKDPKQSVEKLFHPRKPT